MKPALVLLAVLPPVYPITGACEAAVQLATRTGAWVRFDWNGVEVTARGEDDPRRLAEHAARVLEAGGKLAFL